MREDDKNEDLAEDETLLLVAGSKGTKDRDKEYVKKLSNAILQVYYKHDIAKLRCVGAASINHALKAFIIAKGETQKRGDSIMIDPSFTTVTFQGEEKTGIVMEVKELK